MIEINVLCQNRRDFIFFLMSKNIFFQYLNVLLENDRETIMLKSKVRDLPTVHSIAYKIRAPHTDFAITGQNLSVCFCLQPD